jgi:hypothetical protein
MLTSRSYRRNSKAVRVVRGDKLNSEYAPEAGYRYDGVYKLVRYWMKVGKTGKFKVWLFQFRRDDPSPTPWSPRGKSLIKQMGLKMVVSGHDAISHMPQSFNKAPSGPKPSFEDFKEDKEETSVRKTRGPKRSLEDFKEDEEETSVRKTWGRRTYGGSLPGK